MVYVKPMPGKRIIDPERRDWLPIDRWRPVQPSSYWTGLARGPDPGIAVRPAPPPQGDIEGYDPAPIPAKARKRSAA